MILDGSLGISFHQVVGRTAYTSNHCSPMRLMARRLDAKVYAFEDRVGAILLLLCTAIMAGVAYWYPWYLCTYHSAPDDRYGFAIMYAFPFWFIGPALASRALFRLLKAVSRGGRNVANVLFAVSGTALGFASLSPIWMLAWSTLSK
jgi:hypothetical protein